MTTRSTRAAGGIAPGTALLALLALVGLGAAPARAQAGATDTITVTFLAGAATTSPVITSTVGVASNVSDAVGANNRSVVTTTIAQSADLSVTLCCRSTSASSSPTRA